jgi:hypothetical protein
MSSSNNNNQRSGAARRTGTTVDQETKNFEGLKAEIGAVIGLKHEMIDKKKDFEKFAERVGSYVSTSMKLGTYLAPMVTDGLDPMNALETEMKPADLTPVERQDAIKEWTWKEEMKLFLSNKHTLTQNKRVVYDVIYGQCSPAMQENLMGHDDFATESANFNVQWLLAQLRILSAGLDRTSNAHCQDQDTNRFLLNMRQRVSESNHAYYRRFQDNVTAWEISKGKHAFYTQSDTGIAYENANEDQRKASREKYLGILLIKRACLTRYGGRIQDFVERDAKGIDEYPTTLTSAFNTLGSWEIILAKQRGNRTNPYYTNERSTSVSFLQMSELIVNEDGNEFVHGMNAYGNKVPLKRHITCTSCEKKGHYADKCPDREGAPVGQQGGTAMIQVGINCAQNAHELIPSTFIIIDSASTNSCFMNQALVENVMDVPFEEHLKLVSTGGTTIFRQKGTCKAIPIKVWFKASSLANILSLKEVAALPGVNVTMDTNQSKSINVHLQDSSVIMFKQYRDGLYAFDTAQDKVTTGIHKNVQNDNNNISVTRYSFVSTVKHNKSFFTRNQIERADKARKLQQYVGWPSLANFKKYVSNNLLRNTNITIDDISRCEFIYGPSVPQLQGKMTRASATTPIHQQHLLALPLPIAQHHKNVTLCVDYFFVNGISFLHTISRNIQFRSVSVTRSRSARECARHLMAVIQTYEIRGFSVVRIEGDNEFDSNDVRQAIAPRHLVISGRNEHVGPVERSIRTIKERARCTCHALPYKRYTKVMVRSLVEQSVHWLNNFPADDGVSEVLSPATIVQGRPQPDCSAKKILLGAAAIVFAGTTNTMHQRGERAIALTETESIGHYRFMSLDSGRPIHSHDWREVPIDDFIINRVHDLALQQGQPLLVDGFPIFEYAPGVPVNDPGVALPVNNAPPPFDDHEEGDDDTYTYHSMDEDQGALLPEDPNNGIIFINNENDNDETNNENGNDNENDNNENNADANTDAVISYDQAQHDADIDYDPNINNDENDNDDNTNEGEGGGQMSDISSLTDNNTYDNNSGDDNNKDVDGEEKQSSDDDITEANNRVRADTSYNRNRPARRKRRTRWLSPAHGTKSYRSRAVNFLLQRERNTNNCQNYLNTASGVLFAQMSAKKGIKQFGERAIAAMIQEFKQIDTGPMPGKPVVAAVDPKTITTSQKKQALEAVHIIQEKRTGAVKGRTCANGKKQKLYIKDGELYASPTVSLEALMASLIIDVVEGRKVAIFDVPGAYLHAKMPQEDMILMVLRNEFVDIMCSVNPEYKKYVVTDGKSKVLYLRLLRALYGCIQSALLWYQLFSTTLKDMGFEINDYDKCVANKTIDGEQCTICWYVDDNKVSHMKDSVITTILEAISGHFGDLKISRGSEHSFLGMEIKLLGNKQASIKMESHINDAIEAFGEKITSGVATPADRDLYVVDPDAKQLDDGKTAIFHSVVAKLLHISKRARPDIETAVAFLCTRVSKSDVDDWKKLKRVLRYLYGTIDMVRIVGGKDLLTLHTWIDAAYAVHENMRSQTGGCMSFGHGIIHGRSSKQKLNTKSSTESELVGMSDYVPYALWMKNFMKGQGYNIEKCTVHQDNQSAIKMEKNGRNSCTGNSRHIDIRYFFVKDRVDKKELDISYCPTEVMLADFFTKPLQGSLFKLFRSVIMGHECIDILFKLDRIKERVGKHMILPNLNEKCEEGQNKTEHQSRVTDGSIGDKLQSRVTDGPIGDKNNLKQRSFKDVLVNGKKGKYNKGKSALEE